MADHSAGLMIVNSMHDELSQLVRGIVDALADGKVKPIEVLLLTMRGSGFASVLLNLLGDADKTTLRDVGYVLEHGAFVLEE